uniref:Transposase n=1 Tax=Candidatus Kentrum sp. LPFa TaxID=2126335 RepID=A0A450X9R7_9GAMM|nr:MAG: Transposase [Candidatus Kentron sp. LPFa]VFK36872.1 MAG: Transposase [Candidatus Kentron sp. LPFa]
MAEGRDDLKGSKYTWQYNPQNMSARQWRDFKSLRESALKTARAWAIKDLAMSLWHYVSKTWAKIRLEALAFLGGASVVADGNILGLVERFLRAKNNGQQ